MNLKEIKEMIELMKENDITEFEMERDGMKVALKRGRPGQGKEVLMEMAPVMRGAQAPAAPAAAAPAAPEPVAENVHWIKSPMVGTFYRSPSPEADAFVSKGSNVSPEDTVCIIEAMKVMNEIKGEIKGRILEVLVENGEAVEFGQPLFKVEKS